MSRVSNGEEAQTSMDDLYNRLSRRRRRGEQGFTLIELLVVIAILSVLAAIVVFNVTGVKTTAGNATCATDVQSVQAAVDGYIAGLPTPATLGNFSSATTTATSITTVDPTVGGTTTSNTPTGDLVGPYLQTAPTGCSSSQALWGNIEVALNNGDIVVSGKYS
jgi:prepilin-type N-terminal cleavage/methylation domain-containing protein